MGLSRTEFKVRVCRVLLAPAMAVSFAFSALAQPADSIPPAFEAQKAADADQVIADLRQVSRQLMEAVSRFQKHVDDAIVHYDQGYRTVRGRQIQSADVNLGEGQADLAFAARRKLMIARMLGARDLDYEPSPVADLNHIQELIAEERKRVDASDALLRRLLLVSVKDLDSRKQAQWKAKHDQMRKARAAAEEAGKRALLALPIDLPQGDSTEEKKNKAWDLLSMGRPPRERSSQEARHSTNEPAQKSVNPLPIHWEPHTRVTLMRELGYYMALTDSGTEDEEGRHIFYQEEWGQRGPGITVRMRWRVGVDMRTAQHVMIKQYRPKELHGDIDELFRSDRDYLWYLEPLEESAEPSRQQMESAWQELARSREEIRKSVQDFKIAIRRGLARNESTLDTGLPEDIRERLFAIRGHLAGATAVMDPERRVRDAIRGATENVRKLEPMAAWANRVKPDLDSSAAISAAEWDNFEERSDNEIALTDRVSKEALASLPPAIPAATASFPALQQDLVVHVLRRALNDSGAIIHLFQETWRLEFGTGGGRRVRRTAAVISVDSKSGNQRLAAGGTKYYKVAMDGTAEEIFDRYAGQDLPLEVLQP